MLNSHKSFKSLEEEKVYVLYRDLPPARVVSVEKRGRKHYLLLRWENLGNGVRYPERWVKDTYCTEYTPTGKGETKADIIQKEIRRRALKVFPSYKKGRLSLNWFQKLIVKLQNWWYNGD